MIVDGVKIPKRWESIWLDWTQESLSPYAWKETAMRAVRELGKAEELIQKLESKEIL